MITWKIKSMESTPETGVVISANWICEGEQDGVNASISGTSQFPEPGEQFTPYSSLTQEQVLAWVWADGGVNKTATEASVQNALDLQINPSLVQNPLPWTNQ